MTHRQAVLLMVSVTLMWSIAGVVARQLTAIGSFEVTFWRSAFTALALVVMLGRLRGLRGAAGLPGVLRAGGRPLWLSGLCWSVMFTAFMVALTLTTVANVLVTMALAPLLTALWARLVGGQRPPARTWAAIVAAGAGIAWMYGTQMPGASPRHLLGTLIAACVPVAAAMNWTVIGAATRHRADPPAPAAPPDLLPAVLIGATLSSLATLPLALPFRATPADIAWLALLGLVQLAIPCLLAVRAARVLAAPEVALLALLEVIFGVAWAWLGAGETPSPATLAGGALVLAALAGNELLAMRSRPPQRSPGSSPARLDASHK